MGNKILVEIVTAHGCSKCEKTNYIVRKQIKNVKGVIIKEVNVAENPDIAVKYGIMTTPALIIDHKLEFTGVPNEEELKGK